MSNSDKSSTSSSSADDVVVDVETPKKDTKESTKAKTVETSESKPAKGVKTPETSETKSTETSEAKPAKGGSVETSETKPADKAEPSKTKKSEAEPAKGGSAEPAKTKKSEPETKKESTKAKKSKKVDSSSSTEEDTKTKKKKASVPSESSSSDSSSSSEDVKSKKKPEPVKKNTKKSSKQDSSSDDSSSSSESEKKDTKKKPVTKKDKSSSDSSSDSSDSSSSEDVKKNKKSTDKKESSSSSSSDSSSSSEEEEGITFEQFIETECKELIQNITKEVLKALVEVYQKEGAMTKLEKSKNKTVFEKALLNSKNTATTKGTKPKQPFPYKEKDVQLYMSDEYDMNFKPKGCLYYFSGKVKEGVIPHTVCGAKCCSESDRFCSEHVKSTAKYVKDLKSAKKVNRDELYEKLKKTSVAFWKRQAKANGMKVEPITVKSGGKTKSIKTPKSEYPKYKHAGDKERYYDKETGAILRFEDNTYTVVGCDEDNNGKNLTITVSLYDKMKKKDFDIPEKVMGKKCKEVIAEREAAAKKDKKKSK